MTIRTRKAFEFADAPDNTGLFYDRGTGRASLRHSGVILLDFDANDISLALAPSFAVDIVPDALDGAAIGTALLAWSDLFLASGAVIDFADGDITLTHTANVLTLAGGTFNTAALQVNSIAFSMGALTPGTGVSAAESNVSTVVKEGGLITTRIIVDLTGLVGSATDLDIIGNTTQAANAHWGQITAALTGTIIGGKVTCLEVPAGGATDIDFYSSDVATGPQDTIITDAALGTETVLVTSGGAWTSGASKGMTTVPPANSYLYIVNGAASGGTFSAGKFEITLYGV